MTVTFLKSRHQTGGAFDAYEVTLPPSVQLAVPHLSHLHRQCEETVIGVNGYTTWTVGRATACLGPGEQLFIPRGVAHRMVNEHSTSARVLCVLTPGLLGPEYFSELARAMEAEGPTDYAALGFIMARYDVIPATMDQLAAPSPTLVHAAVPRLPAPSKPSRTPRSPAQHATLTR